MTDATRPVPGPGPDSGHTETHDAGEGLRMATVAVIDQIIAERDNLRAERDALAASVARVRELHYAVTESALAGLCAAEDCDHGDGEVICPTIDVDVCRHCHGIGESAAYYPWEVSMEACEWPCDTIRALDGSDS